MKYFFLKTWGNIDIKHILKFIQIRDVQKGIEILLSITFLDKENNNGAN